MLRACGNPDVKSNADVAKIKMDQNSKWWFIEFEAVWPVKRMQAPVIMNEGV
jgi:hypothetical protein